MSGHFHIGDYIWILGGPGLVIEVDPVADTFTYQIVTKDGIRLDHTATTFRPTSDAKPLVWNVSALSPDATVEVCRCGHVMGLGVVQPYQIGDTVHNWPNTGGPCFLHDVENAAAVPPGPLVDHYLIHPPGETPNLGLATTEELFRELIARNRVNVIGEPAAVLSIERALQLAEMLGGLNATEREYRTVDS